MLRKLRPFASILVLLLTIGLMVRYVITNPEVINRLKELDLIYIALIAALYLGIIAVLTIINSISVELCGKKISFSESFKLTSSSSLANFFGPLQSGVGIRAIYFKTKLKIPIKQYVVASLFYYALYAVMSGIFLLFGNAQYRLPLLGLLILGAATSAWFIKWRVAKLTIKSYVFSPRIFSKLILAVFVQMILITAIYFIELYALGKTPSLAQVISYSGAANFSLFVAITPGAIGIREAFLLFSERLHHIDSQTIIAANLIDRSVYVLFLGLLFLWLLATHTKVTLKSNSSIHS